MLNCTWRWARRGASQAWRERAGRAALAPLPQGRHSMMPGPTEGGEERRRREAPPNLVLILTCGPMIGLAEQKHLQDKAEH